MIKPFYQDEHNAIIVEVEDFGTIDLSKLPIRVKEDQKGRYEIGWATTHIDGIERRFLTESGGYSSMDFGGRQLGVTRIIK